MTYQEQLLTPQWKAKRQEVIDYFWGYCYKCGTSKNLEVHHKYYEAGKMAWEYPINVCLIPLCRDRHALEHNKVPERKRTRHISEVMLEIINNMRKLFIDGKEVH